MPPTASLGPQRERYRLDDLTVDVGACRLRRGDEEITLPKLSFDFLTALIRRAPDVVTTDELMNAVWNGTVVSDETVTQRAKLLRDALAGGPRNVQYVETVRGRGYRLAVSVEPAPTTAQTPAGPDRSSEPAPGFLAELARRRIPQVAGGYAVVGWIVLQVADIVAPELRLPEWTVRAILLALVAGFPIVLVLAWTFQVTPEGVVRDPRSGSSPRRSALAMLAALVIGLAGAATWYVLREPDSVAPPAGDLPGIAVLPFSDFSPESDQAYFSDGIHEELLARIANTGAFRVPSRTTVDVYRASGKTARAIAGELGVDAILEGSVRHAAGRVRITVQLIDGSSDHHLWQADYDRELSMENLFAIQGEVASAIARALQATLSPQQFEEIEDAPTQSLAAYDAYLKGLYHGRRYNRADLQTAVEYFEEAIELDPNFAAAWAAIANTYAMGATSYGWLLPTEGMRLAKEYGSRAIELGPDHPTTVSLLGDIHFWYEYDWRAAEREYLRAIELDPQLTGNRLSYAYLLSALSRHDESLDQILICLELEPRSARVHANAAWRYLNARQYERAVDHATQALRLDPGLRDANFSRGMAYLHLDRLEAALADVQAAGYWEGLGLVYARLGRIDEARQQLELLLAPPPPERLDPMSIVKVLTALGEYDRAFEWLERAVQERQRGVLQLDSWEIFDPLRSDPRFGEILVRINLRPGGTGH